MKRSFSIFILFALFIVFPYLTQADDLCNITNCATCKDSHICSVCTGSLQPNIDGTACVTCNVPNCSICVSDNLCGACIDSLILIQSNIAPTINLAPTGNSTGTNGTNNSIIGAYICISCDITNCQECSGNNYCRTCLPGFSQLNGTCLLCNYPCATCDASGACQTCQTPSYFLLPYAGKCVTNSIPDCLAPNGSNSTICSLCVQHYTLNYSANTCDRECPYPCLECDGSICLQAEDGYFVDSITKKAQACGIGCSSCISATICTQELIGFYLKNSEPASCPSFCKSCSSETLCLEISDNFIGYIIILIGNQSKLVSCGDSCSTCSPLNSQYCVQCLSGYYHTNDGLCRPCGGTCKTCTSIAPNTCLSCFKYGHLINGSCYQCNSSCLSCNQNALDTCLSCKQGSYLQSGACTAGCSDNCVYCSNTTTCTQCISGYTLMKNDDTGQVVCGQCISTCRICAEGQPGNCLSCGDGFYNTGSNCVICPNNCISCTSQGCTLCSSGYYITGAMSCALKCTQPCQTCSSSDPTKCTSCIPGYNFNSQSSSCQGIIVCNDRCTYAPIGYIIGQSGIVQCIGVGCRSCYLVNLTQCLDCIDGYYYNAPTFSCTACSTGCANCQSELGCNTCSPGFTTTLTALSGTTGFLCVACGSLCSTCKYNPNQCTSCISGYTLSGWQCVQIFTFSYSLTLNTNLKGFYINYFVFMYFILYNMNIPAIVTNLRRFRFIGISTGSVIVKGAVDPVGEAGSEAARNQFYGLLGALSSGSIAGMSVISSTVSVDGGSVTQSSDNIGIILGICIPIGALILAAIIVIIVKLRGKKVQKQYDDQKMQSNVVLEPQNSQRIADV